MSTSVSPASAASLRSRIAAPPATAASAPASRALRAVSGRRRRVVGRRQQLVDHFLGQVEPAERVVGCRVVGTPVLHERPDPVLDQSDAAQQVLKARVAHRWPTPPCRRRRAAGLRSAGAGAGAGAGLRRRRPASSCHDMPSPAGDVVAPGAPDSAPDPASAHRCPPTGLASPIRLLRSGTSPPTVAGARPAATRRPSPAPKPPIEIAPGSVTGGAATYC